MGIALPGLASGLDTTTLIASLMSVERGPQTLLKNKVAATSAKITDFQTLNTKLAALTDLAKTTAKPGALQKFTATSSSDQITATTTTLAPAGSLDIVVSKTAQSQTSVTGAMTAWPDSPPTLTFVAKDGTQKTVTAATSSIDDMAAAINAGGTGVTATRVAAGTDALGVAQYRLQLTSTTSGADGAFSAYRGDGAAVTAGTAPDLIADPGAATTKLAQDAEVKLWAGTPAEQTVTSKTNTFTDLLPGVNITVKSASATPATVSVTRDTTAAKDAAQSLVVALAGAFSFISAKSTATMVTTTSGTKVSALGAFTGDTTARNAADSILRAATAPVNGISPSEVGITITKNGSVDFDADKFAAAIAADPAKVDAIVKEVATRVAAAGAVQSDKFTGLLTKKITGQQSEVTSLNTQVDSWDRRLDKREATLKRTYSALETMMSTMNSQMAYLTSQINGLSSSNASK